MSEVSPPNKKKWVEKLMSKLAAEIDSGKTPEQALETLSIRQYDYLVDAGIDLDEYVLSPEQIKNISELMKKGVGRPVFPNGYNKKYPKAKQDLYNSIVDCLIEQGAEIAQRQKINFRDIEFTVDGAKYKIVFSQPRS